MITNYVTLKYYGKSKMHDLLCFTRRGSIHRRIIFSVLCFHIEVPQRKNLNKGKLLLTKGKVS